MMVMKIHHVVLCLLVFSGCSALDNLDGLLTLNRYSHEKEEQAQLVKEANAHYERLKADFQSGAVNVGITAHKIKELYGDPVLVKKVGDEEQWVYRRDLWNKQRDKIYIKVDAQSHVSHIELVEDNP